MSGAEERVQLGRHPTGAIARLSSGVVRISVTWESVHVKFDAPETSAVAVSLNRKINHVEGTHAEHEGNLPLQQRVKALRTGSRIHRRPPRRRLPWS